MERNVTSGEKLLKLIRKKDKSDQQKIQASPHEVKGIISPKEQSEKANASSLIVINRFLAGLCLVALCGVLGMYFFPIARRINISSAEKKKEVVERELIKDIAVDAREYVYYEEVFEKKDVFKQPWEITVEQPIVTKTGQEDLSKRLRIVGIMLDETPQVIIEDVTLKQTLFLTEGQTIAGAVIETIAEGQVIFEYNGEKVALAP